MVRRWLVLLCLGFPIDSVPQNASPAETQALARRLVTAMNAGELYAMGMRRATEDMQRQGMTAGQAECVRAVKGEEFEPVLAQVASEELTVAELEEAIRFYETPSGRKYVVMTEVQGAQAAGIRTNKTIPDFTPEEIDLTEKFGKTLVFQKLVNENLLTRSPTGRNLITARTMELLKRCGAGN